MPAHEIKAERRALLHHTPSPITVSSETTGDKSEDEEIIRRLSFDRQSLKTSNEGFVPIEIWSGWRRPFYKFLSSRKEMNGQPQVCTSTVQPPSWQLYIKDLCGFVVFVCSKGDKLWGLRKSLSKVITHKQPLWFTKTNPLWLGFKTYSKRTGQCEEWFIFSKILKKPRFWNSGVFLVVSLPRGVTMV